MKGIILAAGYGTRFLPVTKTLPKEMLPLLTKPAISFIVDEFIASGIHDIVIVTSRRKKALEDFFDREAELEAVFTREGKPDKLEAIAPPDARISFVRQVEMHGTGHALLQAAPFLGGEPCVVAYPDDLHFGERPLARQLMDVYEATGCSVLAACLDPGDVSRYGVIDPGPDGLHVRGFVEKPPRGTEPSHEISIGRYLYTPEFFQALAEGWESHEGGEYYHLYALNRMIAAGNVAWKRVDGQRLDTGEPAGYLEAILQYAWKDPAYRKVIEAFVIDKANSR
ncbi:MAG: UTP--glucose-1-phosphate uridylyltransferase [Spirochaetales bacterium]|nr:MAG: UTP--glucose-1-phosphate uridylyltransferase [Spirochaetales bacterium]